MVNYEKDELYKLVKITPIGDDKYEVLEDFTYKEITVPKGYRTDGADVPRILWSLFPPNRSNYMPAVILHDYLTDKKKYRYADIIFDEVLLKLEVKTIIRVTMVSAVRTYHSLRYHIPRKIKKFKLWS